MPVELTFDTQDAIPEGLKAHTVEKDGKWVFQAETAAEVGNLKNTLKKERDGRTKYEAEVKKFERFKPLMEDEDTLTEFLEAWGKRGENGNGGKPDPKQAELNEKLHAKEIKKRDDALAAATTANETAQRELREFRLWTPLREIAIKSGLIAEDWELAKLDLSNKGQFGFDEEGKIVVLDDGHPSAVTPEKFFKEVYSDQRQKFYKASGAGGSGASASAGNGTSKTITRSAFDQLSATDKAQRMKDGYVPVD